MLEICSMHRDGAALYAIHIFDHLSYVLGGLVIEHMQVPFLVTQGRYLLAQVLAYVQSLTPLPLYCRYSLPLLYRTLL